MTLDLKQARRSFVARLAGNLVRIRIGDLYQGDDAVVATFPDRFREPKVHSSPAPVEASKVRKAPNRARRTTKPT